MYAPVRSPVGVLSISLGACERQLATATPSYSALLYSCNLAGYINWSGAQEQLVLQQAKTVVLPVYTSSSCHVDRCSFQQGLCFWTSDHLEVHWSRLAYIGQHKRGQLLPLPGFVCSVIVLLFGHNGFYNKGIWENNSVSYPDKRSKKCLIVSLSLGSRGLVIKTKTDENVIGNHCMQICPIRPSCEGLIGTDRTLYFIRDRLLMIHFILPWSKCWLSKVWWASSEPSTDMV